MPGHWVDSPEEETEAKEGQDTEEEEEDMADEDASTGSDTSRRSNSYSYVLQKLRTISTL